jgi:SAM-dependent methyltransferase
MKAKTRKSKLQCKPEEEIQPRLRQWYRSFLGRTLLEMEKAHLDSILANLFGYHLLQVGIIADEDLLSSSRIKQCAILDRDVHVIALDNHLKQKAFSGLPEALPIASDSLDVLVLPHALEFSKDPHQMLREADRTLIPEGHLVILGFNPWSFWMLWRISLGWRGFPPWCGRFRGLARLKDWLSLLGFDIMYTHTYFFRPPLKQEKILTKLRFMEKLGSRLWPVFGGGYTLVAKKRVVTLTPIKPRWRPRRSLIPAGMAEPQNREY